MNDETMIANIDGNWYAFSVSSDRNNVYSIGRDCPKEGSRYLYWTARFTASGIKYVATPSPTRTAAYKKAVNNGHYIGEAKNI